MQNPKTILITGAGSGMGKEAAFVLARHGHKVIATTHTDLSAQKLKDEILSMAGGNHNSLNNIEVFKLDITDDGDRQKVKNYDLDVLINNAAVGETGSLAEIPMDRVRRVFETNVFGTVAMTQVALEGMMKKGSGTIVTVSSVAGRVPSAFLAPYGMTKYALSGGFAALREELALVAPNVHISLIEPGTYATGFNQKMLATKYEWMNEHSYFKNIIQNLKARELKRFALLELKSTKSIVNKIVKAVESDRPKLRYSAPWYQAFYVRLARAMGV